MCFSPSLPHCCSVWCSSGALVQQVALIQTLCPVRLSNLQCVLTHRAAHTHFMNTDSMSTVSEPLVGSSRSLSAAKRHKSIRKNSRRIYSAYHNHQQGWVSNALILSVSRLSGFNGSLSVPCFLSLSLTVIILRLKWHPLGSAISTKSNYLQRETTKSSLHATAIQGCSELNDHKRLKHIFDSELINVCCEETKSVCLNTL